MLMSGVAAELQTPSAISFDSAVGEMLEYFAPNTWFTRDYWPENAPRVQRLLKDLQRLKPAPAAVFEPGCANGFISFLASRLGYQVTATDAWEPEDREDLFARAGIRSFNSNLNFLDPWPDLAEGAFDAVLFGEVFEHLLNHPVGLLTEIGRVLKPGGVLLLTTPNPSTLANAVRVLLDRHSMWGTDEFACSPKISDGDIIDKGEVHYREYRGSELRRYLEMAGFRIELNGYVGIGSPSHESAPKRLMKSCLEVTGLINWRPFAMSNYIIAIKNE